MLKSSRINQPQKRQKSKYSELTIHTKIMASSKDEDIMLRVVYLKRWWKEHYFVFYNRKRKIILFSLWQLSFTTSFILDVFFQSINTGWSKTKIPTDTLRLLIIISLWRSMCRRLPHPPRLQPMMSLINIPRRKGHERIVFNQSGRCTCI